MSVTTTRSFWPIISFSRRRYIPRYRNRLIAFKMSNMYRKKVDSRVRTLIENGVHDRHRTLICMIGDKGKEQVVNLHYILSKVQVKARPSVLWCYKKELGFSSNTKKRMKQMKKKMKKGVYDSSSDNPFELFLSSTNIRYTYYNETHKILGSTYGMCVLQDFEALTPNLLARTIETVEGGGLVVILLKSMSSLKQLYTISMDVHKRFRTSDDQIITPRFNERFILSLGSCERCLVVDDELNILPISSHIRKVTPKVKSVDTLNDGKEKDSEELITLKESLAETKPVGNIVSQTKTVDQARAVMIFFEAIAEKTLRSTVALTSGRGRGKSAALGLAVSAAVAVGYANIFVTSPSPENLKTFFQFILKGFDALEYKEHLDYEIIQSKNPEFQKAIVRINIFHTHRQTIQYIQPQHHEVLAQAELLVIDEAAAIPLPIVQKLLGPYLVFMATTINGYEGTGRSLSLKLMKSIRTKSTGSTSSSSTTVGESVGGRVLREVTLNEPIRYAAGDAVEKWLNQVLCLDATIPAQVTAACPHPSKCDLYYVNRDTLFSCHKTSELFLQHMMALYVSSHYKNTPNDLMLMSDAPLHHLFVLLAPVDPVKGGLPEILAVVQICFEGGIAKKTVQAQLSTGKRPAGDLIAWALTQQYQDYDFPALSGARVVRIATHPNYQGMGYGTRSLQLLEDYFSGKLMDISENDDGDASRTSVKGRKNGESEGDTSLTTEAIAPRKDLPPLLESLSDRKPEPLQWLGVSYGMTPSLFKFWSRGGYIPLYIRLTANDVTGEHSCIMLKALQSSKVDEGWLNNFAGDFRKRFLNLLGFEFRQFSPSLALSIVSQTTADSTSASSSFAPASASSSTDAVEPLTSGDLQKYFSMFDIRRIDSYAKNMVDYHVVLDTVPTIARLFFQGRLTGVTLSPAQSAILLSIGLQCKTVEAISVELSLQDNQVRM